jgi:hypothetical protein
MAEIGIVPLLNAQQLSMIWLGHEAAVRPEAAQVVARDLALDLLRQEARQIEKPGASNRSMTIGDDGGSSGGQSADLPRREKSGKKDTDGNGEPPASPKPLVGNLLNVRV